MTYQFDPFASATDLLHALRAQQVSAVELLDLHLRRIERFNPQLNAKVTLDDERARRVAAGADKARSDGEEKLLPRGKRP